jgi:acyl-CoA thioesterase
MRLRIRSCSVVVTPDELARACAEAMAAADRGSREAGIELRDVGPGRATTELRVAPTMVNGHRICHGGYVFLLADTAFAYACNTHGDVTVAAAATSSSPFRPTRATS